MIAVKQPLQVAVVAPIMVRYDAISLAARDTVRLLADDPCFDVRYYGRTCEFPEVPHEICSDISQLLLNPSYQRADVAIFHFGIYSDLFYALLSNAPRVRIVHFHNVTPPELVGLGERPNIVKSMQQIELLRNADEIWAVSATNAEDLFRRDFRRDNVRVVPLVVQEPALTSLECKPTTPVEFLFIGRIVPSKGVHDLIAAIEKADLIAGQVRFTIAGNTSWSDRAYLQRIQDLITTRGLKNIVRFIGTVDNRRREQLFHAAHVVVIPSYHEGFCRPVAEGLRAGCIPIVYDAYNLPRIAAHLGRVLPTGNVGCLAAALAEFSKLIPRALADPTKPLLALDRGDTAAAQFSELAHLQVTAYEPEAIRETMQGRVLRLARAKPLLPPRPCHPIQYCHRP